MKAFDLERKGGGKYSDHFILGAVPKTATFRNKR